MAESRQNPGVSGPSTMSPLPADAQPATSARSPALLPDDIFDATSSRKASWSQVSPTHRLRA